MKIDTTTVARMAAVIEPLDTMARRHRYLDGAFTNSHNTQDLDRRYRWDLLWESGAYDILVKDSDGTMISDSHIDTALRRIVPVLDTRPPSPFVAVGLIFTEGGET